MTAKLYLFLDNAGGKVISHLAKARTCVGGLRNEGCRGKEKEKE